MNSCNENKAQTIGTRTTDHKRLFGGKDTKNRTKSGFSTQLKNINMVTHSFIEIDLPEGRYLKNLFSMQSDMLFAKNFAENFREMISADPPDYSFGDSLTIAMVTSYCQAFTSGVRRKIFKGYKISLKPEQANKHQYFLDLRNEHIAHSVNDFEKNTLQARYVDEKLKTEGITQISCSHERIIALGLNHTDALCELANIFLEYVERKIEDEKKRLLPNVREKNYWI